MADMTRTGNESRTKRRTARTKQGSNLRPAKTVRAGAWDSGLLFVIIVLCLMGLIAMASASYAWGLKTFGDTAWFLKRQGIWGIIGIVAMIFLSKISYKVYAQTYHIIAGVTAICMVLVAIPGIGKKLNGARRWLFFFQPSELLKIAIIVLFAYWIAKEPDNVRTLKGLSKPYGVTLLISAGLLLLQKHTSATIIVFAVAILMLYCGGMRLWYFAPIGIGGGILGVIFYSMNTHVQKRIGIWLDPFSDIRGDGFQGSMGQIAIGSGGIFGAGLGQGKQKHLYLPETQNDFIFANWCEEMGWIGALIVLALFGYLIYRGCVVAKNAPDRFSALLAVGITAKIAIQTVINLWVVTGLFPVTGASLPFFSYGGTALVMQLCEMGILLNISRYMRADAKEIN